MFIATQLNSTQLNSTSSYRHVHSVNNCHLSMNVVTQLTQFVSRDVINKNDWLGCTLFNWVSWVELCRYKHPFNPNSILRRTAEWNDVIVGRHQHVLAQLNPYVIDFDAPDTANQTLALYGDSQWRHAVVTACNAIINTQHDFHILSSSSDTC